MVLFLDTSAVIKLYHEEEFSKELNSYLQSEEKTTALVISQLGIVEFTSAVWRKQRSNGLQNSQSASTLLMLFEADVRMGRYDVVENDAATHEIAVSILNKCNASGVAIKSLDALQLAAAIRFSKVLTSFVFLTSDKQLAAAATFLKLQVKYFGWSESAENLSL